MFFKKLFQFFQKRAISSHAVAPKTLLWAALFILAAASGFGLVFYSQSGKVHISLAGKKTSGGEIRKLAEEEREEVLTLSPGELKNYGPRRLFAKSYSEKSGPDIQFYLGNFIAPSSTADGKRAFICDLYDWVEMAFSGLDSTLSGRSGGMAFKAPCRTKDRDFIGPFLFPAKMVILHSERMEFESGPFRARFYNMAPLMNDNWLLVTARFFNAPEEDGFLLNLPQGESSSVFELNLGAFKEEQ